MNQTIERRTGGLEYRQDEKRVIGHAAVFDRWSNDLGGFVERIAEGAFGDLVNDPEVMALINHDMHQPVGKNGANLRLVEDTVGLRYELTPPDTTHGRDLVANLDAGIVTRSSFGFLIEDQEWELRDGEPSRRTVLKVKLLVDVSPVTMMAAYNDTSVALRMLEDARGYEDTKARGAAYVALTRSLLGPYLWAQAGQNLKK